MYICICIAYMQHVCMYVCLYVGFVCTYACVRYVFLHVCTAGRLVNRVWQAGGKQASKKVGRQVGLGRIGCVRLRRVSLVGRFRSTDQQIGW